VSGGVIGAGAAEDHSNRLAPLLVVAQDLIRRKQDEVQHLHAGLAESGGQLEGRKQTGQEGLLLHAAKRPAAL